MNHHEQGHATASAGGLLFAAILGCLTVLSACPPEKVQDNTGEMKHSQARWLKGPRTSDARQTRDIPSEAAAFFRPMTHHQGRSRTIPPIGFQTRSFGVISQFEADTAAMAAR
jgi:hypothetical protein